LSIGIAVSGACLYFASREITDWGEVWTKLAGARPGWLGAVIVASLATVYIRAQRWRVLLRPLGDVPLYPALSATAIGFGANSVLPFRLGELVRPALLGLRAGVRMGAALSTVVLERLFDVLLVISCFLAASIIYPELPADMRRGAFALGGLAALGFIVLVLMQRHDERAEVLISRGLGFLPASIGQWLQSLVRSFMSGLGGLKDLSTALLVLGYSAYLWGVITLTFLFSFLALDMQVPLIAASLTTAVAVAAAVFVPQAPGFVGVWQAACVAALPIFGVSKADAFSYGIFTWVLQMAINIGTAGVFLVREDLSLGQLLRVAAREG
jgi:glycosyltransferase 2 family protein